MQGDSFELQLPQLVEHLIAENNLQPEKGGRLAKDIHECSPGGIGRKNTCI